MSTGLVNFLLFQLGWLGCVLSAAAGRPWLGAVLAAAIIGWHLWRTPAPGSEIRLIAAAVMIGAAWDSFLVWQGWLAYHSGMLLPFAAPYWILVMWALFATTLNVSLRWLKGHRAWAAVLGGLGGPLAYYAGERLEAVSLAEPVPALLALGLGWAVITPLLMALSTHFDGHPVQRITP